MRRTGPSARPRLDDDPKLKAVWRRLALRAGITVATGALQGWLDAAEARLVRGWARDAANSDMPVPVEVVVDGLVLGSTLANHYRADLATAGYGQGRHGFEFRFPAPLASDQPHMLVCAVRAPLTGAPRLLPSTAARVLRCSLRSAHRARRKAATGHEDTFPWPRTSARYRFS